MKKYWPILRTLTFLIVGLMNTLLIRPEDTGTWKNYIGYLFLAFVVLDIIMYLIKKNKKNIMWYLLKTEISYFKWLYIFSLAFVIIVNFGLTIDGRWIEAQGDFPGLRIIWMGVGIVVLFFAILFNRKSGRLKTHKLIPLTNLQLSLVRLLAFIGFWCCLLIILFCFYIFNFNSFPTQNWMINLVSITGIIFLINSVPILYSDFYSTYFTKKEKFLIGVFWSILWIIYITLNIIFMTYLDFLSPDFFVTTRETLTYIYFTPQVTIFNIIVGFSLFFLSLFTFRRRKLYLE